MHELSKSVLLQDLQDCEKDMQGILFILQQILAYLLLAQKIQVCWTVTSITFGLRTIRLKNNLTWQQEVYTQTHI